jgi:DUF1680 family protein
MKTRLSRRKFLRGIAAAAAIAQVRRPLSFAAQMQSASREKLFVFSYADVKLTGGPLRAQQDRIHASYLALDEDKLLKVYRQRAGLPAPGEDMGGWYDADGFGPGQVFGQIISGLSRFYNSTGDPATQAKVQRLVNGFAATVGSDNYWFPSQRASTESSAYVLDKITIGLLDASRFAAVPSAGDIAQRCIQGSLMYLPARPYERVEAPKQAANDEPYTLPENLFYTYEATGDEQYRELAKKYLEDRHYFDPLSRGENVLPGLHAYSHVNALCSGSRAYLVLGDQKYLQAVRNAWEILTTTQSYASGGWAPNEEFVVPNKGVLGDGLDKTHLHFETPCGSYAHLKLSRYLLRITADARYGDSLERVLYNTVLGAKDPKGDGHVFYYSDYHSSARKTYHPDKWPCCSGTLPQVVADYSISSYFRSPDGIYVNLYTPSEVTWKMGDVPAKLVQTTTYPEADSTEFRVGVAAPTEFTIYLRIPAWLRKPAQISVNGNALSVPAEPGAFAAIRRRWQANDTLQLQLPFSFRLEKIDDQHPDVTALMWGPLMMVALDPSLAIAEKSISASSAGLKAAPFSSLTFELPAAPEKIRFKPFYQVQEEEYTTYLRRT